MAKQCIVCEKGGLSGRKLRKLRGKYNPTQKRKKYPNLQWVKIPFGIKKEIFRKFSGKKILACTKCIKALAKRK